MSEARLIYDDLKLGEKAVEMYRAGASVEEIAKNAPVYLNTSDHFYGLNNTDIVLLNILVGGNALLVGRSGCGKSQIAEDIHNYFFGGSVDSGGRGLTIEGDLELRIMEDVFTSINIEKGKRVFNNLINANYINLEEINRCPPVIQNQFFAALNNRLIYGGEKLNLGNGFCPTISTANLGNGRYKGTFDSDISLYNRFGVVINLDEPEFKTSYEDRKLLNILRPADSKLKNSPVRDITQKIMEANREIKRKTLDLGLEGETVIEFLQEGLDNCSEHKKPKDLDWDIQNRICQLCLKNSTAPSTNVVCSMVQSPVPRTLNSIRLYSAGMDFLFELKGLEKPSTKDIIFKAFELSGAYQGLLNNYVSDKFFNQKNSLMMKEVVRQLKEDYIKNEDRIITALESAQKGVSPKTLFAVKKRGKEEVFSGREKLTSEQIDKLKKQGINVDTSKFEFNDVSQLGYSWVEKSAESLVADFSKKEN